MIDGMPPYEFIGKDSAINHKNAFITEDTISLDIKNVDDIKIISLYISRLLDLREDLYNLKPDMYNSFEYWSQMENIINQMIAIYHILMPHYKSLIKTLYPSVYNSNIFMLLHIRGAQYMRMNKQEFSYGKE